MRYLSALLRQERGQILLLVVLLATSFLAFVGLVVDTGFAYAQRRQAQNAADQAALAAAHALFEGSTQPSALAAAFEYAAGNGYDNVNGNTITVNNPPLSGQHVGDPNFVEVIVEEQPATFLIHVIVPGGYTVRARGVAGIRVTSGDAYSLFANSANCSSPPSVQVSGSVSFLTGAVHSNSDITINGSNTTFDGPVTYSNQPGCDLDISGSGNTFTPAPATAANRSLPLTYSYSAFPCTMTFTEDTALASVPAAWVGGDPSSGQMVPGVYCSTGKLVLGGSDVTGNVTLVAQGAVNLAGSNFNLTPYWNDVLAFSDDSGPSALDMSGSGGNWEGIFLAPNGHAKVQGSSNLSIVGSIMADTIHVSGSDFSLTAIDYGFSGPLKAALVE